MATTYVDGSLGSGGTGTSGDPYGSLQSAIDNWAAGDLILCKNTQTIAADLTLSGKTPGTAALPIEIRGVDASWADTGTDYFTIDANSATNYCLLGGISYIRYKNIKFINSNFNGWSANTASSFQMFYNCESNNHANHGWSGNKKDDYSVYYKCRASGNGGDGFFNMDTGVMAFCTAIGNSGDGFDIYSGGTTLYRCIAHNNGGDGFNVTATGGGIIGCTSDGNTDNGVENAFYPILIANNRLTNNTGEGVELTGSGGAMVGVDNAFYNNNSEKTDSGTGSFWDIGDDLSATGDGYTDKASDDFTLASDGEGVGVSITIDTNNSTNETAGLCPEYGAGGGGNLIDGSLII